MSGVRGNAQESQSYEQEFPMMPLDKSEMYQLRGYKEEATMAMWRAGADFFSSKYSLAERCQMARDCYEAMIRA